MSEPVNSKSGGSGSDADYTEASGGVTTVSSAYSAASPFSDDSPDSPYGSSKSSASAWSGSPYEPLDSETSVSSYPSTYSVPDSAAPTYVPAPDPEVRSDDRPPRRQTKQRAIAGLFSAILGTLLVGCGLYLIGEFGMNIFDAMLNGGGQPSGWDIAWTSVGAALIFVAVLLNGWSPWASLVPGAILTGFGVWSLAWYDGADRVASFIDELFTRPELVVWGITGWMLTLGLMLLGASFAVVIARAVGRRRPLA
jgi:hypothetical protein